MIAGLTGRLLKAEAGTALIELQGVTYEVHVPAGALEEIASLHGQEITLHTIQYIEGSPGIGNLMPRLIGFLTPQDREFFNELTRVRGLGMRKCLRAMAAPTAVIAAAIERGDERALTDLPEVGKKLAAQIVADLRGKLARFAIGRSEAPAVRSLSEAELVALNVLVQWGDRRADAQRWIAEAVDSDPTLRAPEEIIRAAYSRRGRG